MVTPAKDTLAEQSKPDKHFFIKYTEVSKTDKELQTYTSRFYCPGSDGMYNIVLKDHQLMLINKYYYSKLTFAGKDDLLFETETKLPSHLKIVRNSKGSIIGLEVNDKSIIYLRFNKI